MQYLESFENYQKHNEIFTGLGRLAGRAIGAATNFLSGRSQATNTSDNDLAREILAYVQNMPRNYNTTGQLNYRNVNKTGNTRYMFIGNPFDTLVIENDKKLSGKEKNEKKKDIWSYTAKTDNDWRIDILKHGDYKTTNDPEYAIYISKVSGGEVRPETPPVNREPGPDEDEQKENKLACTQGLAEEIWQLCYEINQATTRTNTGDARGGVASQQPFRPRY